MNDVHSFAGEYAVGRLTADETQEFEAHLATCPECREEVADMRDLAVQLSEAVATDPPPDLRASVLAQIAHTAQDKAPVASEQTGSQTVPAASTATPKERLAGRHLADLGSTVSPGLDSTVSPGLGSTVSPSTTTPTDIGPSATDGASGISGSNVIPMQRRAVRSWATGILTAAAVLAAIAMGGWAISSRNDARDATAQTQQLTQLLAAKDVKTATGDFGSGGGTVIVSATRAKALLIAADVPKLPTGRVYEAWTGNGAMVPAGTFTADGSQTVVNLPSAAVGAATVAVTVEPEGGSQQPTTAPVFSVDLPTA